MECIKCNLCSIPGRIENSPEVGRIRSNVRQFQNEAFTVWRCVNCGSLHCQEDIDYAHYYENYPLQKQKPDFFTLQLFSARLRQLISGGLSRQHSILDYGCGNGGFVKFIRSKGYSMAEGYDPYSDTFSDQTVLQEKYDYVACQDVIEHAPDTASFLTQILELVRPGGGAIAIGTPDAAKISLNNPLDAAGQLHQPHHRHLLTKSQLEKMIKAQKFEITQSVNHWYVDTWIPFLNSRFFFSYVAANGGAIDSMFEPINYQLLLSSPKLVFLGLFGRFLNPRKDMFIVARSP